MILRSFLLSCWGLSSALWAAEAKPTPKDSEPGKAAKTTLVRRQTAGPNPQFYDIASDLVLKAGVVLDEFGAIPVTGGASKARNVRGLPPEWLVSTSPLARDFCCIFDQGQTRTLGHIPKYHEKYGAYVLAVCRSDAGWEAFWKKIEEPFVVDDCAATLDYFLGKDSLEASIVLPDDLEITTSRLFPVSAQVKSAVRDAAGRDILLTMASNVGEDFWKVQVELQPEGDREFFFVDYFLSDKTRKSLERMAPLLAYNNDNPGLRGLFTLLNAPGGAGDFARKIYTDLVALLNDNGYSLDLEGDGAIRSLDLEGDGAIRCRPRPASF